MSKKDNDEPIEKQADWEKRYAAGKVLAKSTDTKQKGEVKQELDGHGLKAFHFAQLRIAGDTKQVAHIL